MLFSINFEPLGSGRYVPRAWVLLNFAFFMIYSASKFGFSSFRDSPKATSHMTKRPIPSDKCVQQYGAAFPAKSEKYMPFPKRYPVFGASGGAILIPFAKMPAKFENLDP